jgi:hypothetical protein
MTLENPTHFPSTAACFAIRPAHPAQRFRIAHHRCLGVQHYLIIAVWDVERRALRADLDHRAVRVAARRHKGVFKWAERKAVAAHQFYQYLGNVLQLTRRDRHVVDHPNPLRSGSPSSPRRWRPPPAAYPASTRLNNVRKRIGPIDLAFGGALRDPVAGKRARSR